MPTANRNTEVSRVVSGDSQQKHILRVIVARTRRYLNNLLAGNLDWIFYFYLFIFFKFSIVFIYFFSSKAARACCDRTRSWFLTVWPSLQPRALIRFGEFLQPFLIEFPRYLCLQPGFFFSFTIGIFPFFTFRHFAKMTLIKRKGVEYNSAPKYVKTWGKTLTDRTDPN